ncbi:dihydrolipoamide acetyltransferase family protein [Pseudalkalibacillus caeni]|uniref:Dihydrolipoamide acetyltransferase component of pyruvate dehydrogenase complex n=1 Tax=Exobacillus caeni TaxID=2574798 RepID=A0A5R9F773_9BACL|nr:dihydrolipoamide acetyltransferase family protein [Pseudalkalibacillus caeni]TLS38110.1 2-oxo acid dehydrogenase subunit E2 [Pseudalkalibacillus caeni]
MVEVKLHDIGEGMTEGEIIHLLVKPGEMVGVDQPLLEVQTDKVTAELTAPSAGKIKELLVKPGDVVEVGTTLVTIETESKEPVAVQKSKQAEKEPASNTRSFEKLLSRSPGNDKTHRVLAAPYTRKIARENGIDIEKVTGTGSAGRVLDEDVYNYLNNGETAKEYQTEAASSSSAEQVAEKTEAQTGAPAERKTIPFKGRRKQIARKMTQSLYTIPHVTHFDEVDVTNILELKKELQDSKGIKISVPAFLLKALALTLKEFPIFNSRLDEEKEEIVLHDHINLGIATDAEEGLIVPVLMDAQNLSIKEIHSRVKELTKKAQTNQLTHADLKGGTFTVSNVGPLGSTGATPIINYPEVALMAFHKTKKMPVVRGEDQIVIRSMMNVSVTFDHRVIDGGASVAFTNRFMEYVENPSIMLLELV